MFQTTLVKLSRPQRQHFRKKIPNFYSPYLGASFMKWYPVLRYKRSNPSLFHYPKTSVVTGQKIGWMYNKPMSGFEGAKIYGPNTIEVRGLPMGKTPEYLQERLRRYFSKFGPVVACRALNHPLDPYQCSGIAYVSFRERLSVDSAVRTVIRLPHSMGNRTLSMRDLATDETVDGRVTVAGMRRDFDEILIKIENIYKQNPKTGTQMTDSGIESIYQLARGYYAGSRDEIFGLIFSKFFIMNENKLFNKILINFENSKINLKSKFNEIIEAKLTQPWRPASAPTLPEYTKRRIGLWDKKDKLPFDLQILSRDFRTNKIHGEKFILKERLKRERSRQRAENRAAAIAERKGKLLEN
jgi:hypothetical protein